MPFREETRRQAKLNMATESELYLNSLCQRAFLRLWSYASPYRDQGRTSPNADGKELCDLLVVIDRDVIIFSDKWCAFPESGNLDLDWKRWRKKAIKESQKQILGAEKWLRKFPERIFQDRKCTETLFSTIPSSDQLRIHRVVVAHDSATRCRQSFRGGSGSSILLSYGCLKDEPNIDDQPFHICEMHEPGKFVHVLDDVSLDIVLESLDTATDFLSYLAVRERLLSGNHPVVVLGEEELLGLVLSNHLEYGTYDLPSGIYDLGDKLIIGEGIWGDFTSSGNYQLFKERSQASYYWDHLIDTFTQFSIDGGFDFSTHPEPSQQIEVLQHLALEHRIARTILSRGLLAFIASAPTNCLSTRVIQSPTNSRTFYAFLTRPNMHGRSAKESRWDRRADLHDYCFAVKHRFPSAHHVIGIATEPGLNELRSEDMFYLITRDWSKANERRAASIVRETGFTTKMRSRMSKPFSDAAEPPYVHAKYPKVGRNDMCPCGSGKKFKYCHLRL